MQGGSASTSTLINDFEWGGEEQGVDWRELYRKVHYALEASPGLETAAEKFYEQNDLGMGKRLKLAQEYGCVVVPRSPGLASHRKIWGLARRVVKEMRRVMEEWGRAREVDGDRGVEVGV